MPSDGKIRFSLYELLKVLGKSKRGGLHEKVRQSLDRIGSTIYYSENAFYVREDERLETYRFTLWSVHFSRARSRDGRSAEHHTPKFDDLLVKSYNSGYLKLLDTDLYFALGIPLAKALYRLVDQRRGENREWEVDARQLRDLLAMSIIQKRELYNRGTERKSRTTYRKRKATTTVKTYYREGRIEDRVTPASSVPRAEGLDCGTVLERVMNL